MFNSLIARKKSNEAAAKLRRIIDLTTQFRTMDNDPRIHHRCDRTIPVLITPWRMSDMNGSESHFGISQDISDQGMRILFMKKPVDHQFLISFIVIESANPKAYHFLTEVQSCKNFCPDIFSVGLLASEFIDEKDLSIELRALLDVLVLECKPN